MIPINPTLLVQDLLRICPWQRVKEQVNIPYSEHLHTCPICKAREYILAKEQVGLTRSKERMPQTPDEFQYMGDLYEKKLLEQKDINSDLRAENNRLRQKLEKRYAR